jgi:hypothetical protein
MKFLITSALALFSITALANKDPLVSKLDRYCTAEVGILFHPATGQSVGFRNGCDKNDLLADGYLYSPIVQISQDVETFVSSQSLATAAANGGINPVFFGLTVTAKAMLGSNPCGAQGLDADFEMRKDEAGVVTLTPILKTVGQRPEVCTREFKPVYKDISYTFIGSRLETVEILVENVDELGATKSVFSSAQ